MCIPATYAEDGTYLGTEHDKHAINRVDTIVECIHMPDQVPSSKSIYMYLDI